MTDSELINGCARHDRACQKKLYERFYGKMMAVCMRYAKNKAEAKDMLQEGFIKVFTKLKSYQANGSLEGWVRRIIVNTAVDTLRSNKQEYTIVNTVKAGQAEFSEANLEDNAIVENINREAIIKAVQELTPAYRTVFNLYVVDGYTHKEISEILNISEGTSKSNLSKAKFNLRKNLSHLIHENNGK